MAFVDGQFYVAGHALTPPFRFRYGRLKLLCMPNGLLRILFIYTRGVCTLNLQIKWAAFQCKV